MTQAMTQSNHAVAEAAPSGGAGLVPANMSEAIQLASMMADSKLVPQHLQGAKADCFMVVEQASRWRMSPFAVAQSTSCIQGKLMFEGKLVVAAVHNSGILSRRLNFDFEGEGEHLAVVVSGTIRGEDKPRTVRVMLHEVKTNNRMWTQQPQQQLCYSGARVWARRHAPEVMLGVYVPEEFSDETQQATAHAERDVTPAREEPQALPHYPQDKFDQNFDSWAQAIADGRATPDKIIAKLQTLGQVTDEQADKLRACKPAKTEQTEEA